MSNRLVLLLLLLLIPADILMVFALAPARAEEAACLPIDPLLDATAKDGLNVRPLPQEVMANVARLYNRTPPASEFQFEAGAYVEDPDSGGAFVVLLRGGLVCGSIELPPPVWARLKRLMGERS